ncbi:MAG TPA: biotin--[acetyl-CoA-carboxylase] ligase, partial [bacterium]|nr:biotin--[acetyl-CoA-carboxylase] ligase [bacterium]
MNFLAELRDAPWKHFDTIDSTNRFLAELGKEDLVQGFTCTATVQTHGKGRGIRKWVSPAGGIYMSILLKPDAPVSRWHMISLVMACAAAESIEAFHPDIRITLKWPNDVLANGRKCAGILVQSHSGNSPRLIVGIGVNAAIRPELLPERPLFPATVLNIESRYPPAINRLAQSIRERFFEFYLQWLTCPASIVSCWNNRCAVTGTRVRIEAENGSIHGFVRGLS